MDLTLYIIFSAVYVMVIHFAFAIKNEFNLQFMIAFFVLGGIIGWYWGSMDLGFIIAVVLSLVFG